MPQELSLSLPTRPTHRRDARLVRHGEKGARGAHCKSLANSAGKDAATSHPTNGPPNLVLLFRGGLRQKMQHAAEAEDAPDRQAHVSQELFLCDYARGHRRAAVAAAGTPQEGIKRRCDTTSNGFVPRTGTGTRRIHCSRICRIRRHPSSSRLGPEKPRAAARPGNGRSLERHVVAPVCAVEHPVRPWQEGRLCQAVTPYLTETHFGGQLHEYGHDTRDLMSRFGIKTYCW